MFMVRLPPAVRETLFWLNVRPEVLEDPEEVTVTERGLQLLLLSQTVTVALPAASAERESVAPEMFADTTLVLELLEML